MSSCYGMMRVSGIYLDMRSLSSAKPSQSVWFQVHCLSTHYVNRTLIVPYSNSSGTAARFSELK